MIAMVKRNWDAITLMLVITAVCIILKLLFPWGDYASLIAGAALMIACMAYVGTDDDLSI